MRTFAPLMRHGAFRSAVFVALVLVGTMAGLLAFPTGAAHAAQTDGLAIGPSPPTAVDQVLEPVLDADITGLGDTELSLATVGMDAYGTRLSRASPFTITTTGDLIDRIADPDGAVVADITDEERMRIADVSSTPRGESTASWLLTGAFLTVLGAAAAFMVLQRARASPTTSSVACARQSGLSTFFKGKARSCESRRSTKAINQGPSGQRRTPSI